MSFSIPNDIRITEKPSVVKGKSVLFLRQTSEAAQQEQEAHSVRIKGAGGDPGEDMNYGLLQDAPGGTLLADIPWSATALVFAHGLALEMEKGKRVWSEWPAERRAGAILNNSALLPKLMPRSHGVV